MLSVNSGVAVVVVRGAVTEASVAAVVNLWAVLGDRRWQRQRPELRGFYPHAFLCCDSPRHKRSANSSGSSAFYVRQAQSMLVLRRRFSRPSRFLLSACRHIVCILLR
jgi:hypothetical protein